MRRSLPRLPSRSWTRRRLCVALLVAGGPLAAQEIPAPTELLGEPFFVKKTWLVEVDNHQDYRVNDATLGYLALDPAGGKLFIAHGPQVEIVDIQTGTLDARIHGLSDAKAIVLDPAGTYGYVADGPAGAVVVFDRATPQIVEKIPSCIGANSLALEAQSGLLFEVCSNSSSQSAQHDESDRSGYLRHSPAPKVNSPTPSDALSFVAVIDTATRKARLIQPIVGKLGFAQAGADGAVYIAFTDRSGLLRIDAVTLHEAMRGQPVPSSGAPRLRPWDPVSRTSAKTDDALPALPNDVFSYLPLYGCDSPRALAVDGARYRLFTACENTTLFVTDSQTGRLITTLPIGPGTDDVGYDPDHRLIFAANGGSGGSLTIIHQHNTDSYHVVQNLPTRQKARTLAVDSDSGWVYLVVPSMGVKPEHAMSARKPDPAGNFEVLAIGK